MLFSLKQPVISLDDSEISDGVKYLMQLFVLNFIMRKTKTVNSLMIPRRC